jgi:prolyl-tRNA synthetase
VAPQQVVIVPITRDDPAPVLGAAEALREELAGQTALGAPVRASVDSRDRKPADKRWEWIRKGAPLVIELGERDIEGGVVTVTRRDDPELGREPLERDKAAAAIPELLAEIQNDLLGQAKERLEARTTREVTDAAAFREWFSGEGTDDGGFVRAPWSEEPATEETMGELGVSVRCIPFDQKLEPGAKCVISGAEAQVEAIFAKAY